VAPASAIVVSASSTIDSTLCPAHVDRCAMISRIVFRNQRSCVPDSAIGKTGTRLSTAKCADPF
jgi:hypothetical protein